MNDQSTNDELQRTDEHSQIEVAPPRPLTRDKLMAGASVSAIVPRSFEEVWRVAQLVVKSGLAPRDLAQVERAAVAIMHGMEIGLKPMAAMQRIAVINGRPSVWGDAVPAIALDTGQLVEWAECIEGTGDDMTAKCRVVRRMGGTTITKVGTFSVADAKKADLWDERKRITRRKKDGSGTYEIDNDSPWHRYPKRMLQMRARVAFRDLFSDALCGLYIAEELVGRDSSAEMRDVTPTYERISNPLGGNGEEAESGVLAEIQQRQRKILQEVPDKIIETRPDGGTVGEGNGEAAIPSTAASSSASAPPRSTELAGASEVGTGGNQPQDPKASPGPANEPGNGKRRQARKKETATPPEMKEGWTLAFTQPWNRQSSATYVAYALNWMEAAPSQERARERWNTERAIRNGLANLLDEQQMAACQEALGKVGA